MNKGIRSQPFLLGYLWGSMLLVGGLAHGAGLPPDGATAADGPRPNAEDCRILEAVLFDIANNQYVVPFLGAGDKTKIVLGEKTATPPLNLHHGETKADPDGKDKQRLLKEIGADLKRRNPRRAVSLATYTCLSPHVIVGDLSGKKTLLGFRRNYPDAKGFVEVSLPGYSEDGQTAILMLRFGPCAHGTMAAYRLVKAGERWRIVGRSALCYL